MLELPTHLEMEIREIPTKIFEIYKGEIDLYISKKQAKINEGKIYLNLTPELCIYLEGFCKGLPLEPELINQDIEIQTSKFNSTIGNFSSCSLTNGKVRILINSSLETVETKIDTMYFFILNYVDNHGMPTRYENTLYPSRINLEYSNWQIVIDKRTNYRKIEKQLQSKPGFHITHIGRIKKKDGSTFYPKNTDFLLDSLIWLLSFSAGMFIGIPIIHGYRKGDCVWKKYRGNLRSSTWEHKPITWFLERQSDVLRDLYKKFTKKLQDPIWKSTLKLVIDLYITNREIGVYAPNIILIQAALETLAWTSLTQGKKQIKSKNKFKDDTAAKNIEDLLSQCKIPTGIPDIKRSNWKNKNGPQVLITFRNAMVHPDRREKEKKRNTFTDDDSWTIVNLGLWYIELCILSILGYDGKYRNRLQMIRDDSVAEKIEKVPWMI